MVATFDVMYDWGGVDGTPGTSTDTDALGPPTLRFKNADDATIDTNNKLVVPDADTKYSMWKHIYLKCSNADSHTMNNFRFYTDGVNSFGDAGIDVVVGLQFPTKNSGATTGYEVAVADDELVADHGGISSVASVFDYSAVDDALTVSCSEAGNVINAANETTNYILLQMTVASTVAIAGDLPNENGYIAYDEA